MSDPTDPFGPGATPGDAESAAASDPAPVADPPPALVEEQTVKEQPDEEIAPADVTEPEPVTHRSPVTPTVISSTDSLVDDQPPPVAFDNTTPGDKEPSRPGSV